MATSPAKIVLSRSQDIPFNKLVLSQANVRKVKAGVSIADLAEDIVNRTLLHGLPVRPRLDAEGKETGIYEVTPGGRRYRALELLVKQKRLSRTAPIPCVIRTGGLGEEDSLAENLQRVALHPLDQFRTFQTLRDKGLSEEDIAARFFITPAVVKQRLRLASVSPRLLDLYAEDGMTLELVMAFSVSSDHEHQEQVWASLTQPWQREAHHIRRALTADSIPAHDKRAQLVGLDAYVAAGGPVMRDLFTPDDGGWLGDVPLLERLAAEKLAKAAETVMEEGWKWIEVETDFLYGHTAGQRRLRGEVIARTEQEEARYAELQDEYDRLAREHDDDGEISEEVDQRLTAITGEIAVLEQRPVRYDPEEIARAGCYVSIGSDGQLRVERGYVRPEDEPLVEEPVAPDADLAEEDVDAEGARIPAAAHVVHTGGSVSQEPEPEDEGLKPLPERLVMELTAFRTLALRDALAQDPDTAFIAALHLLCLQLFYYRSSNSCLQITARSPGFMAEPPGLADSIPAQSITARHENWEGQLPDDPRDLWDALVGFDADSRAALFAHCVGLTVHAVQSSGVYGPESRHHADRLASAVNLDMAVVGWVPTALNYLGRVTKARILEAVVEAKGEAAARQIDHLRKPDMAVQAELMLAGTNWLPALLRTPEQEMAALEEGAGTVTKPVTEARPDDVVPSVEEPQAAEQSIAAE
ncbi:ParB N-terminal domain-containing protein [Niveispirillum sp. KHB5.9]|uniref:ParB/RepB/Spo0J family partition protein n=1 Tax=Niveispirillum sp. KHB5.9 TaxID=3400269 RepID=UPI003A8BF1A4